VIAVSSVPADVPPLQEDAGHSSNALFEAVYARLKAIAGGQLASRERGSLNTTALVHELYLRVSSNGELTFAHPAQFFAYAACAMRHYLSDRARDRLRLRAGGDWQRITITGSDGRLAIESAEQALALEAALQQLENTDARSARVVELHYFAGLTLEQIADTLDLTRRTIDRDWRFARAFLHDQLR
jgi:RNA polymerase sigma factor (TIGR02999 family)